jgi:uroporphyrinogen-III synthase
MNDKTILITRPLGDERALADLLHGHGYRVIHEPLTTIYLMHQQRHILEQALYNEPDAVILTSRHAVHALAALSEMRDLFLLCVGEATAKTAFSLGFDRVSTAGGTSQKLLEIVTDSYDPGSRFVYVSGTHVRVDLDEILTRQGMQVQRVVAYEAVASEQLSDTLIEHLRRRQLDGVTFLSQRTSRIFIDLLSKAGAMEAVSHLHAFCLSETVAEPLQNQPWQGIHVTREATLASMLDCVDTIMKVHHD